MAQPTHSEIQAVDPVLNNLLVGYQQSDTRFVANRVFPVVPVDKQSFTYYVLGKKYFFADELKARTPGAQYARAGYGVSTATGFCNTWGLEHVIPDEARANNQMPMQLEQIGTQWLAQQSLIRREKAFSDDFMKTGVWATDDNNAATDWDDPAGDPFGNIMTARRTISNNTGFDGNAMVLGYIVHAALMVHSDIINRVQYVQIASSGAIDTIMGPLFDVQYYLVSKASYNSANEGQAFSASPIIDDDCLICYINPNPGIMSATAGLTFAWDGGGGAGSVGQYRDETVDSDVLKLKEAWDQKAVATDLGYFFADIV